MILGRGRAGLGVRRGRSWAAVGVVAGKGGDGGGAEGAVAGKPDLVFVINVGAAEDVHVIGGRQEQGASDIVFIGETFARGVFFFEDEMFPFKFEFLAFEVGHVDAVQGFFELTVILAIDGKSQFIGGMGEFGFGAGNQGGDRAMRGVA